MYLQDIYHNIFKPKTSTDKKISIKHLLKSKGGQNVASLGFVSLFTDISSEMITAIIPLYLTTSIGLSYVGYGFFEGAYQAFSSIFRLWGGQISDKGTKHKKVAIFGYGLSTLTRLGLYLSVFISRSLAIPNLLIDRIGKGIRVAPRDAMISLSVNDNELATAYGIHRTLDTIGALIGPLIAFVILLATPGSYDTVFFISFIAGIVGLSILIITTKQPSQQTKKVKTVNTNETKITNLFKQKEIKNLLLAVGLLNIVTISDPLVFLYIFRNSTLKLAEFPLLFSAVAVTFLLLATPIGKLSDKYGRKNIFIFGYFFLGISYLILANISVSPISIAFALMSLGVFYACTDGVIAAIASSLVDKDDKGKMLGLTSMTISICKMIATVLFGYSWQYLKNGALSLNVFTILLIVAILLTRKLIQNPSQVTT